MVLGNVSCFSSFYQLFIQGTKTSCYERLAFALQMERGGGKKIYKESFFHAYILSTNLSANSI